MKNILLIFILVHAFFSVGCREKNFASSSMEPTILDGDAVNIDSLAFVKSRPKRYDIVSFYMNDPDVGLAKEFATLGRVVGVPGDSVVVERNQILVNGTPASFKGISYKGHPQVKSVIKLSLGKNDYYILGDNVSIAKDSRFLGPVPLNEIVGKVIMK